MTSVSDTSVTTGRPRHTGSGIVLAGDRTDVRRSARRHSTQVRLLKYTLPLSTLVIAGLYGASVLNTTGWGTALGKLEIPTIIPENIAMENPHYEGFNKDGGRYWVRAKTAQQDLKNLNVIKLDAIIGELTDAQKQTTKLTATRGTFDNKANVLELFDAIDIAGETGLKAHLQRATVKTKENVITSDQPVSVAMDAGTITAKSMTVRQKSKEYTFVEDVRTHLTPKPQPPDAAATPASKGTDQGFGNSNEPVDIASKRLDINDAAKVALFTGDVKAVQGQATLSSPELEVTYEGSATPQPGQPQADQAGGKVNRIVAKDPVVMTQGNGDRVTSNGADFDAINQRAVLDGSVVMTQAPDKRATGDRAEIDQGNNTVLLTGAVVVSQGINELKGRRLYFDRGSGKMQLTAQGGPGRVTARFQQSDAKSPKAAEGKPEQQGVSFGATFKTDPDAPVNVEADRLDVDDHAKQAVFSGDVKAVQGEFVIRSAELTATYSGSAGLNAATVQAAAAPGAAKLTRIQARKKVQVTSKDGQNATGDWADFDTKSNTATLGGNVVLTQNKNIVRGTKLVIDMTTGESVIKTEATATSSSTQTGSGEGNSSTTKAARPSAIFYPGDLKAQQAGAQQGGKEQGNKGAAKGADGWEARADPSNNR